MDDTDNSDDSGPARVIAQSSEYGLSISYQHRESTDAAWRTWQDQGASLAWAEVPSIDQRIADMKVKVDALEHNDYDDEITIGVYLDDGTEVGRYCVVADPDVEAVMLEKMIRKCVAEEFAKHPVICNQCAKPVEVQRYCYAVPVCFKCLPPPPPLQFIDEDDIAYKIRCKEYDDGIGVTRVDPSG